MLDKAPNGKVSDLLNALDKALDYGDDDSGLFMKYLRRG